MKLDLMANLNNLNWIKSHIKLYKLLSLFCTNQKNTNGSKINQQKYNMPLWQCLTHLSCI